MKRCAFTEYHPIANFLFFAVAIVMSVVIFHPVALGLSLLMALALAVKLEGARAVRYFFGIPFVVMILSVIVNPLFVHKGITVMFYIGESPVTLEALIYGANTALMLGAVIMWFYCYGLIMTSDRFMAVFGKRAPAASLVFSMVLRFIPRVKRQTAQIAMAQRCLGRRLESDNSSNNIDENRNNAADNYPGHKTQKDSLHKKLRGGLRITSIMTTWALENSIDTADSMRARGYGSGRRTFYSKYEMRACDIAVIILLTTGAAAMIVAKAKGVWDFYCYPEVMTGAAGHAGIAVAAVVLAVLYACPVIIEIAEEIKWKRSELILRNRKTTK